MPSIEPINCRHAGRRVAVISPSPPKFGGLHRKHECTHAQATVVACGQRGTELGNLRLGHEAVDVQDVSLGDLAAAEGDHLVQDGLGIAHAAVGEPCNAGDRGVVQLHLLRGRDRAKAGADHGRRDGLEVAPRLLV
jgi:hypothetical protein